MTNEKRFLLFIVLSFTLMLVTDSALRRFGLIPPPPEPKKVAAPLAQAPEKAAAPDARAPGAAAPKPAVDPVAPATPPAGGHGKAIATVDADQLRLGSNRAQDGYRLAVQLDQRGAGVASIASTHFEAERDDKKPRHQPLQFIEPDKTSAPSFALTVGDPRRVAADEVGEFAASEVPLDGQLWEVVRDDKGRIVRPIEGVDPKTKAKKVGQEVVFRATLDRPDVVVTKRFRLWKGEDGLDLELGFEDRSGEPQQVVYRLTGPHNIPIEGLWYTSTFRDIFFDQVGAKFISHGAGEVVQGKTSRLVSSPLRYAGVEDQYFAVFVEPVPTPATKDADAIAESDAVVIRDDPANPHLSDVTVRLTSKPLEVGPGRPVAQSFRIFAGPKTVDALAPYNGEELASYRRNWVPGASLIATNVIAPLLEKIYALTAEVARWFGGKRGSYGIAIILLTITVRLMMFPLSRRQAMSAKRMQDLQPLMVEIKEKYKDDKEKLNLEMMGLYRKQGVNPFGGCLTALIQLPIFIGLWQALNNSVALRHARFLWIENLAAPDMLFKLPFSLPFGKGEYFNILPFVVVALMLVQTKLFAPPPTTPEAEMQQKMMKFMMIFMAFMFYTVPSGLGIYFITSSLWAIGERLLLPKMTHAPAGVGETGEDDVANGGDGRGRPGNGRGGNGRGGNGSGAPGGWLSQKFEALMEEAGRDRTIRKEDRDPGKDRGKPRARPGPGKRR